MFVTIFHDFSSDCQLRKWVHCIGMNKINQSVLKSFLSELDGMNMTLKSWHGDAQFVAKIIKVWQQLFCYVCLIWRYC